MSAADQLRSITREGYERLQAQLEELVSVRRAEVARRVRDARDGRGEPDENVEHAGAREEHVLLEQIAALRQTLALVEVIDYDADGTVGIGAHVRLLMPHGVVMTCQLVGTAEAEPRRCRISIQSPIGQAIIGRREGDVVAVDARGGAQRIEILQIEACADALAA